MPVMCYECAWRARDLREMPCVDACEERAGTAQAKPGDVVLCAHARARTLRCAGYREGRSPTLVVGLAAEVFPDRKPPGMESPEPVLGRQ